MSGVYIKGMQMPTNCFLCPLSVLNENRLFCEVTKNEVLRAKIDVECPLIPVPDHGDLIDREAIPYMKGEWAVDDKVDRYTIEEMPTIIPADKEADNV